MSHEIELTGLDGSNPLAFLAALGTVRVLSASLTEQDMRMAWRRSGAWRPVLHSATPLTPAEIVAAMHENLQSMVDHPALPAFDNLNVEPGEFRGYAREAASSASPGNRTRADFAAAFACESMERDSVIQDTAFRTMSGAGHQHFVKTMRDLIVQTSPDQLRQALFEPWAYRDPKPSLRWDPEDDRRYALRWKEPSADPIRTVRGANRIAVEALPLLPVMPVNKTLVTTGFTGRGSRDTNWTWPLWNSPVNVEVIRSVLAMKELQKAVPNRELLLPLGIVEVYRSQRLTIGKFRNFAPAQPV